MQLQRERGITLISLMVGTTISLLLVAAMLQIFKSVIHTSADASKDAKVDTQLTSALLTTALLIQKSGFGIDDAKEGTDFIWLTPAILQGQQLTGTYTALPQGLAVNASTNTHAALIWRNKNQVQDTASRCEALYIAPTSGNAVPSEPRVDLYHLQSSSNCPANLQSVQWNEVRALATGVQLSVQAAWQECTPMGHTTGAQTLVKHVWVQITATSSSGIKLTENYCLRNFSP